MIRISPVLRRLCLLAGLMLVLPPALAKTTLVTPGAGVERLPGTTVEFEWTTDLPAGSQVWLYAGPGPSSRSYADSGLLNEAGGTRHRFTVSGLPDDERLVYLTLWERRFLGGGSGFEPWTSRVWSFYGGGAQRGLPPAFSGLRHDRHVGSRRLVSWGDFGGPWGVTEYYLYAGTSFGGRDLADSGSLGLTTSYTIEGLPEDGTEVFVRLWSRDDRGRWFATDDVSFISSENRGRSGPPDLVFPPDGSTLSTRSPLVTWDADGLNPFPYDAYGLEIGSSPGARNIYDSDTVDHVRGFRPRFLPEDGRTLYGTLNFLNLFDDDDELEFTWTAYDRSLDSTPTLVRPSPEQNLIGTALNLEWTANASNATDYWVYAGSGRGGRDLHDSGSLGDVRTYTATIAPTPGQLVHLTFWYRSPGGWKSSRHVYTHIGGVPQAFVNTGNGFVSIFDGGEDLPISDYWLYVGTRAGTNDIYDSGVLPSTVQSFTADSIAEFSSVTPVYVRLWYRTGSPQWKRVDYVQDQFDRRP